MFFDRENALIDNIHKSLFEESNLLIRTQVFFYRLIYIISLQKG